MSIAERNSSEAKLRIGEATGIDDLLVELQNRTACRVSLRLSDGRVLISPLGRIEVSKRRLPEDVLSASKATGVLAVTDVREPPPSSLPWLVAVIIDLLLLLAAGVVAALTGSAMAIVLAAVAALVFCALVLLLIGPLRRVAERLPLGLLEFEQLPFRLRELASFLLVSFIVVAVPGAILFFGSGMAPLIRDALDGDHVAAVALIGIAVQEMCIVGASSLPILLYFVFDREKLRTLRSKFTRQILRLDPGVRTIADVEAKYGEILDEAYGQESVDRFLPGTRSPILIATSVLALGWTVALLDTNLAGLSTSSSLTALIEPTPAAPTFAFLGAYFFTLNQVLRGYVRGDLRPKTYAHVATRTVSVVVLAYLLERMLAGVGAGQGNATLLTLAFISGVVPETVLVRISELARGSAGTNQGRAAIQRAARTYETDPLTQLEGIDIYDRARLLDEGVTNVEALAHHDLVDLLLRTRIPAARLVDWVDQAILYLHSAGRATVELPAAGAVDQARTVREVLRDLGIRTATELERAHKAAAARGPTDETRFLSAAGVEADGLPVLRVILDAVHDEHWMHSLRRWHGEPAVPSLLRVPEDLPALFESPFPPLDANALSDSPGASDENGDHSTERV